MSIPIADRLSSVTDVFTSRPRPCVAACPTYALQLQTSCEYATDRRREITRRLLKAVGTGQLAPTSRQQAERCVSNGFRQLTSMIGNPALPGISPIISACAN